MLAQQRQAAILDLVRRQGGVRVSHLVRQFGVSDMTIRRGLVDKVHGGATVAGPGSTEEPGFDAKSVRQRTEKAAIAARAAQMVEPGTAVALSAGTTTAALASLLLEVPGLTVVTNSGPVAEAAIASLNVDVLFLGVHGMSPRTGFTTPNLMEAGTNRLLVAASRRLVVLADHTKWETVGIATIAPLEDADVLITDSRLPSEARAQLSERVGELIVV